jgi:hypothetical protein
VKRCNTNPLQFSGSKDLESSGFEGPLLRDLQGQQYDTVDPPSFDFIRICKKDKNLLFTQSSMSNRCLCVNRFVNTACCAGKNRADTRSEPLFSIPENQKTNPAKGRNIFK